MRIRNVRVIDPANDRDGIFDILILNGSIAKYENPGENTDIDEEDIDAAGLIGAPGFVDVHVHFRDPGQTHKEDIHTGAASAVAGGYTSVIMMGNTAPSIDNEELLKELLKRGEKEPLNIYSCVNATKSMGGRELIDYAALKKAGAVAVTDDGKPITDERIFRQICTEVAKTGLPLSLHEENPEYISENGVNSGEAAALLGLKGSDPMAEISIIKRDLEIAKDTGVILSVQHISTKEGVELVRQAKRSNPNIHAEATPHHFSLTDEAVAKYKTLAKMNPPLRKYEDMIAIREGLRDGTIDMIATDHAPHSSKEKEQPFTKAPSGIIGLETALSLAITNLVETGVLTLRELIEVMSVNAARLYKLPAGNLAVGNKADLVIFSPDEKYRVPDKFYSKSVNSPFIGWELKGKVKYTIAGGKIVYRDTNKE